MRRNATCERRYGLRGFYCRDDKPITLTKQLVDGIHLKGGTMLVRGWAGARRGAAPRAAALTRTTCRQHAQRGDEALVQQCSGAGLEGEVRG